MAEELPRPDDITPDVTFNGGVINPLSLRPIELDLPEPPRNYPLTVAPSTMIPTQGSFPNKSLENAHAILDMARNAGTWAKNPYHYGKERSYNADYDGANFERYAKVPRLMREYGFSPYRDNEKIYNENATNWEYFKRSWGQSWNLIKLGFHEMLPWNAWDGEEVDSKAARQMERAHAIGSDSRGGFGSWFNNMVVDSGYTVGILSEFAAEELVGWIAAGLLSPFTGGLSLSVKFANTLKNVNKLRKLWNVGDRIKDVSAAVSRTYDWIRNGDKMRDFYNFAKSGIRWGVEQLTPETVKWADDMLKNGFTARGSEIMIDLAKASKGFGAFYRDARAYAAIVSEAKLEGGSTELQVRDKLIDEYVASHNGEMPNADELTRIYRVASEAGQSTFWWNLPALFISNKIVFDKALKGFKPISMFREEFELGLKQRLVYDKAWKQAGKKAWEAVDQSLASRLKNLTKASTYNPKNLLKNNVRTFVNYSKANLTEGLQEVYQDIVQNTMVDYYSGRHYHPALEGSRSVLGSFLKSAGETITSEEGWHAFSSGFFMGGMVQMPQKVAFEWLPKKWWQITDKEGYAKYMADLEEHKNSVVNALNAATMDEKFWDSINENAVQQINNKIEAEKANAANDKKSYYDIIDESVFNHLYTLLKTNKINIIRDHIKDLKKLDEKSLQEAFGPVDISEGTSMSVYQERLDSMLRKLELVESHYKNIEEKFRNPFNPARYNAKRNPYEYHQEKKNYEAFEEAKKTAVYSSYAFERAIKRMKDVMDDILKNKPLGEVAATDFTLILDEISLDAEIGLLKNEIETFRKGDEKSKAKANKLQEKLDLLTDYQDALKEYKEALHINSKRSSKTSDKEADHDAKVVIIGKIDTPEIISEEADTDLLDASTKNLYEKYHNYLKFISAEKGTFASDENILSSFQKLKDYYNLNRDAIDMALAVDILHNPLKFSEYADRVAQIYEESKKQHKDNIEKSYLSFLGMRKINELFNQLYNMGVFLDEGGIKAVLDRKMPNTFYDIATKQIIYETNPKWKDIKKLFESFNFTTTEPIQEDKAEDKKGETEEKEDLSQEKKEVPSSSTILTLSSSVEDFRNAGVLDDIIKAYREFVNLQNSASAEGWVDKFALEKTDEQIAQSDAFRLYLQMSPGPVNAILNKYNQKVKEKESAGESQVSEERSTASDVESTAKALEAKKADVERRRQEELTKLYNQEIDKEDREALDKIYHTGKVGDKIQVGEYIFTKTNEDEWSSSDDAGEFSYSTEEMGNVYFDIEKGKTKESASLAFLAAKLNRDKSATPQKEIQEEPLVKQIQEINAKYDAELAALEKAESQLSKEQATPSKEAAPTREEKDSKKTLATRSQKKQLVDDFGYNWSEVNAMTYTQAQEIIDSGLTKEEREAAKIAEAEAERMKAKEGKESKMRSIEERIANSHYIAELSAIESEIAEAIIEDPLGIDTERLEKAIQSRKEELAREINFEDINENEVVIMKDNRRMVVVEKTANKLKLRKFGETAGAVEVIYPNEVQSKILYKDQPFMEKVDINPPVTQEAQQTSNENIESAKNLNTTEAIQEDVDAAKKMTNQEVDDEFNNSIGCK